MAQIVTRETGATAKNSPLTNSELDNNFINLNNELSVHNHSTLYSPLNHSHPLLYAPLANYVVADASGYVGGSNGIAFPAISVASANPTVLDDYEEGVFTPTIVSDGVNAAWTINTASTYGRYVKIGQLVNLVFQVAWSAFNATGASGNVYVGGVPFAPLVSAASAIIYSGLGGTGGTEISLELLSTNSRMYLFRHGASYAGFNYGIGSGISATGFIRGSLTYRSLT